MKQYSNPLGMKLPHFNLELKQGVKQRLFASFSHYIELERVRGWCFNKGYAITFKHTSHTKLNPQSIWKTLEFDNTSFLSMHFFDMCHDKVLITSQPITN